MLTYAVFKSNSGSVGEPVEAWHWFGSQYLGSQRNTPRVNTPKASRNSGIMVSPYMTLSHHKSLPTLCTESTVWISKL
jgi:hypothetical protein